MGYHPRWFPSLGHESSAPAVEQRLEELDKAHSDAEASHAMAAELMRNHGQGKLPSFQQGQRIWLEGKNITTTHPSAKLRPKRFGPFTIEEVLGPVTYRLKLPAQWTIHPVFHANLLTPYHETNEHGPNSTNPPPDVINEEEEWEVDKIQDTEWRKLEGSRSQALHFLVHYAGYDNSENQWRPSTEFHDDDQVVLDFYLEHPDAPSHSHKPAKTTRTRPRQR